MNFNESRPAELDALGKGLTFRRITTVNPYQVKPTVSINTCQRTKGELYAILGAEGKANL